MTESCQVVKLRQGRQIMGLLCTKMSLWLFSVFLCSSIPAFQGFDSFQGVYRGHCIKHGRSNVADHDADASTANLCLNTTHDDDNDYLNRRKFVNRAAKCIAIPCVSNSLYPAAGWAQSMNPNDSAVSSSSLLCLQDLPPYDPKTTVRLFLCRHGETENNRLNIIQGARIDPPINEKGVLQATLLGLALSNARLPPSLVLHSPLLRARQTANLVSDQLRTRQRSEGTRIELRTVKDLAEVDFGSIAEGAPVSQYRSEMISLYSSWAFGNLNARMPGGGESGYEILSRIQSALQLMIEIAAFEAESSCLAAITHSSYLRLLIGAVDNFTIFSATSPQSNCGINVLDFPRPDIIPIAIPVTGEASSRRKPVPAGKVIRVNEKRHLSTIQFDQESSISTLIQYL